MRKQHILYIVVITILFSLIITIDNSSYINDNNVSALDYSSNIGIGFTFNPTLSISLSSNDLVIPNLAPGTTEDSNSVNVSVVTNAAYGYTLSANVNNENLVHSNSNNNDSNANANNSIGNNLSSNVFSSIATNANLASLDDSEDTNIWGYSTSLDNSTTWSNYNGLANSNNAILLDTSSNVSNNIGFKIAAKASNTQPSGVYTGTINFYATTKPTPITLSEAYASEGKTMINGYYTMQDMTSTICEKTEAIGAQLQVLDIRDNKLYWISKLADNHCWMTQNLDLDLSPERPLTSEDTDISVDSYDTTIYAASSGYTMENNVVKWTPERATIIFLDGYASGWNNLANYPYSANPGDIYYYTSNSDADDIKYNSLQECIIAGHNDCMHYHVGNYYNWSATVASNNSRALTEATNVANSICPYGWRLSERSSNDIGNLLFYGNIITEPGSNTYGRDGFGLVRQRPIYLVRTGYIRDARVQGIERGYFWYSNSHSRQYASSFILINDAVRLEYSNDKANGYPVRCLAR